MSRHWRKPWTGTAPRNLQHRSGQPTQFTSLAFKHVLITAGIRVSMDGKGRWMDNVFIERLWRSLKYERVYLHAFETGLTPHAGLEQSISHHNTRR